MRELIYMKDIVSLVVQTIGGGLAASADSLDGAEMVRLHFGIVLSC